MLEPLKLLARPNGKETLMTQDQRNQFYWSPSWRDTQRKIVERDNHECQVCKDEGKVTVDKLIVHHIKPLEFYPDLKLDEDNLLTVCINCHNSIHFEREPRWDDEWW